MTEDRQLLNADVQEEFARLLTNRKEVDSWLEYIRNRRRMTCIPYLAPEYTPEEIFGELTLKIYDENMLWDRNIYPSFTMFMFGKLQNIIRGIALKAERHAHPKNKNAKRVSGRNVKHADEGEEETVGDMDISGAEVVNDNSNEFGECEKEDLEETEYLDKGGDAAESHVYEPNVRTKKKKTYPEPSISLNINIIDKKLPDESDPYVRYKNSFSARFNRSEFGNIVEEILFAPEDTELLALYVGKFVEEKRREEIMEEYRWSVKEYNSIYKRLLYKLSANLPERYKEMVRSEE
jgi:hypothetical protein